MNLSNGEKLIILMLSELYDALEIDGEIEPDFLRSAIFGNQLWGISWKYSGIPFDGIETPREVREVVNILDMWSFIEESIERCDEESRQQIEEAIGPLGRDPRFHGFDGNNETEHMAIASFLVNDLDRFTRFGGRSLNSHMPVIDRYRRMLPIFERFRPQIRPPQLLTANQLIQILTAGIHPENRP